MALSLKWIILATLLRTYSKGQDLKHRDWRGGWVWQGPGAEMMMAWASMVRRWKQARPDYRDGLKAEDASFVDIL